MKLIWVGDGEYVEPIAKIGECKHPREYLRFDARFSVPIYVYCCACGQPYLHPMHGLSQAEIDAARQRADQLMHDLGWE